MSKLITRSGKSDPVSRIARMQIRPRHQALRTLGVNAQAFAGYVNRTLKLHQVDVVLMTCVLRGQARHQIGSTSFAAGPGSVGITHYNQAHDLITDAAGVVVVNLYLDLENHPLPVLAPPHDQVLAALLSPDRRVAQPSGSLIHIQLADPKRMEVPLRWMLDEQQHQRPGWEAMMRHALAMFLVECCRAAVSAGWSSLAETSQSAPPWFAMVQQLLDTHYARPLGLADMVRVAGVSPEHLCRTFRRVTGRTPIAYLNDRRLQAAAWRLRTGSESVTQIALASGFNDLSHFNRQFKQRTDQTPSQYRQQP